MAITTADEFFAVLEKSELLDSEQFADARAGNQGVDDPAAVAKALVSSGVLTRWQAGQLLAGRSSFFLGKYKLIELLGRGGMGSVFLGQHTMMNRHVALKILSKQFGKDPESLERFLSEARAVAALDHPNIVQAYSVDNESDRYYIVMEYVDGRNLQQIVETDGPLYYETAADYIRQAADGLAQGHSRDMIHGDIKPSNLLLNDQGVLKIVDMGLTLLTGRYEEGIDGDDEGMLGSIDYMAPEQAVKSTDFDHRADIYSLGCTLYFLLTGHPPFPGGPLHERLMKHQTQEPRSIIEQRPDTPTELVEICRKMMAKRPEDRHQSAEEVSRVLAEWQPPRRQPKRLLPLKRAERLEKPVEQRLPSINVDVEPKPTAAAAGRRAPPARGGVFRTRQQRTVAAVVAALAAVVLLAATVLFLVPPASDSGRNERDRAGPGPDRPDHNDSAGRKSTPTDESPSDEGPTGKPPSDKRPADKPLSDRPPAGEPPSDEPSSDERPSDQPPVDEPGPDEQPTGPPETDKPKPDEPDPDELKPDKPEPEDPKPAPPEPARPEKEDPFRDLPKAAQLPSLKAKTAPDSQAPGPISLGELHLASGASVDVELLGGKDAVKGSWSFAMDPDQGGDRPTSWRVHLDVETKLGGKQRTEVAQIRLQQQELQFQWLPEAGQSRAGHLRNCGLKITVDGQTRWLPLSQPKELAPLELDLQRGSTRMALPAEWLPDASTLRLQVTGLGGPFPRHEFRPGDTIAVGGKTEIGLLGENLPDFKLRVALNVKGRAASVDVSAVYTLPGQPEAIFKAKEAESMMNNALAVQHRMKGMVDRIRDREAKQAMQQQISAIESAVEQLGALGRVCQAIHKAGKVHFRVFTVVGDHQIDLFTTPPPGAEVPEENKKDRED